HPRATPGCGVSQDGRRPYRCGDGVASARYVARRREPVCQGGEKSWCPADDVRTVQYAKNGEPMARCAATPGRESGHQPRGPDPVGGEGEWGDYPSAVAGADLWA